MGRTGTTDARQNSPAEGHKFVLSAGSFECSYETYHEKQEERDWKSLTWTKMHPVQI